MPRRGDVLEGETRKAGIQSHALESPTWRGISAYESALFANVGKSSDSCQDIETMGAGAGRRGIRHNALERPKWRGISGCGSAHFASVGKNSVCCQDIEIMGAGPGKRGMMTWSGRHRVTSRCLQAHFLRVYLRQNPAEAAKTLGSLAHRDEEVAFVRLP